MPAKPKPTKKKTTKPVRQALLTNSKAKPTTESPGIYISVGDIEVVVSETRPKAGRACGPFSDFAVAKSAAVDGLIDAIETAEQHLFRLKQATSAAELRVGGAAP